MAKVVKKPPTKSQILQNVAESTGLTKKDVSAVLDALQAEIKRNLAPRGAGAFILPGLLKIVKKRVAAKPARKNVENPFKPGEFRDIAAKPAHNKVTIRALKNLKEMV